MRDVSERENNSLSSLQSLTSAFAVPNDLGSGPIYRFLQGSQFLQMTKIPLMIIHFCEITNSGHIGNKPFLVLQVDGLLGGLVQILEQSFGLCNLGAVPLYSVHR